jgi:hypothetical protein
MLNSIANINPIMLFLTPLTSFKANSLNYIRVNSLADLRIDFKLNLNVNSLINVY